MRASDDTIVDNICQKSYSKLLGLQMSIAEILYLTKFGKSFKLLTKVRV